IHWWKPWPPIWGIRTQATEDLLGRTAADRSRDAALRLRLGLPRAVHHGAVRGRVAGGITVEPMTWLSELGATSPVVAAPMAGGPTTPELVLAAAGAGSLGFLAGGYLTADALGEQLAQVRAAGTPLYGVNLFAPN